jgi:hypothetical protein
MKKFVLLLFSLFAISLAFGSHLRCGYITAQLVNCASREYLITITVYTNTSSDVKFGGDGSLNFGDGTSMVVPRIENILRPDLGPNIGMASYTVSHTYGSYDTYLISYVEPNRNGGVLNMNDSFFTTFYVETSILINTEFGCATSPEFLTPAVLQAAAGTELSYSLGVSSEKDDLITYELVTPFRDRGLPVNGYIKPGNASINYLTGLLTWDTKFSGTSSQPGEYSFAVQINHHVKTGDTYTRIGFVRIDFQVIVIGDVDQPVSIQDDQELDEYSRLLVLEGDEKGIEVFFESTVNSTLEVFSELVGTDALSFETHEEGTLKVGILTIKPDAALVRENPYLITIRANSGQSGSDINYLIYTEKILDLPVITLPVITAVEKEVGQVDIYPNPTRDKIVVKLTQGGASTLTLFTIQGVAVRNTLFESETEVMLSDLPAGIYICEVRRNSTSVHRIKVIKTE